MVKDNETNDSKGVGDKGVMHCASADFPVLETDRFILRQFTGNDLENVFQGLSNPEVIRYYGVWFVDLEATHQQLDWFKNLEKEEKGIWWAIASRDSGNFYGACGLNDLDTTHKKAEVGFWLLPEYWGNGIMVEVMPRICHYGFEKLKLHRLEGFVESENRNCKKALAKLDFRYEGTMTDCEIKDGKYISLDIYAMINPGK